MLLTFLSLGLSFAFVNLKVDWKYFLQQSICKEKSPSLETEKIISRRQQWKKVHTVVKD